jgi:F-type H+-transporting ATPase subunit gamma
MATLRDIKRRITSIGKIQQVTRAMQMVAAARLRKTQETALQLRSYLERMTGVVERLVSRTEGRAHPLLTPRKARKLEVLVITPDKGLCGGFNLALCQSVENFIAQNQDKYENIALSVVGKKGDDHFKQRSVPIRQKFTEVSDRLEDEWITSLSTSLISDYLAGTFDVLYLFYHRFKSVLHQIVVDEKVIPLKEEGSQEIPIGYLFEPDKNLVLEKVLSQYLKARIYSAFVESTTSEHAARMSAMDLATRNAREMIETLTLTFNKARQEVITKELIDIVGGAEALK